MTFDHDNIISQVPIITSVEVTSNKPNPIRPIGSDVVLTCTVEVNEAVSFPVNVTTSWMVLNGNSMITNTTQPSMDILNTTYISTAWIKEFEIEKSGFYTCLAEAAVMAENLTASHIIHTVNMASKLITTGTTQISNI